MRIISGKYRGRLIKMPRGIRPTQDKVRKALFDILGDIEGLSFLELFAGAGAVGIEALSYGAKKVVFVENNPGCVEVLKSNLNSIPNTQYSVLAFDVSLAIKYLAEDKAQFDIIFLDPPYHNEIIPRLRLGLATTGSCGSLAKKTLLSLSTCDILSPIGFIVVQHFKKDILPDDVDNLTQFKQARYGDTILSFYRKKDVLLRPI